MTNEKAQQIIAQAKEEKWEELDIAGMDLEVLPPEIGETGKVRTKN
ncbi:hypothetical protein [Limnofasciculus baicalensis]|uniref:Uncharacterized protein n=1 Tax=Limnofasciculus baicalensis BBK-W-15 TaxID=2699891 RepID=A0AAE3GRH6_9CYAN|nr:hypothetical protein [Limnofasciculus baicalensis]MCP2729395.1 hypothetical protein [Limnofasciculus baicalensis BBK-W-15]